MGFRLGSKGEAIVLRVVAFRVRKIQSYFRKRELMSGDSALSNDDVAASGARRLPDRRLRDHDADKKLNVEVALGCGIVCRMASRGGPPSCAGNVIKGKRAAREIEDDGRGWLL